MNMKKLLTATAVIAAISTSATALAATPYVEGALGYANARDVDTNTYSGTLGSASASNAKVSLDYDSSAVFGAEFGFKDVLVPNVRVGASVATMKFDLNRAQLSSGSVNDGTTTYNAPYTISKADVDSYGVNLDNRVNLYMLNAYYDFKNTSDFTPFVGFGIGLADVKKAKDNEFAYSLSAGAKYNIEKNIYLGAKAAYTRVNGPTDEIGIKYQNMAMYSASVMVGCEF